jgi:hypothetical protein
VAEKVLVSRKLLWSAPHLFNDPFDHQVSYRFPFSDRELAERLFQAQQQIVFGHDEPIFLEKKPLGDASLLIRKRGLQGAAQEDVLRVMKNSAEGTLGRLSEYQEKLNGTLKKFLAHSRVLCVSENNSNVVMWAHYADQHRGAVFKFNCIDTLDDNLLIARKVTYSKDFPDFLPLTDWVDSWFGLKLIDYGKMAFDLAFIKHKDWEYEQEWRVHIPLMSNEPVGDGRSFYEKSSACFGALYLGCRMQDNERNKIISLAKTKYPHMEIFQAFMSHASFSLEFQKVT